MRLPGRTFRPTPTRRRTPSPATRAPSRGYSHSNQMAKAPFRPGPGRPNLTGRVILWTDHHGPKEPDTQGSRPSGLLSKILVLGGDCPSRSGGGPTSDVVSRSAISDTVDGERSVGR